LQFQWLKIISDKVYYREEDKMSKKCRYATGALVLSLVFWGQVMAQSLVHKGDKIVLKGTGTAYACQTPELALEAHRLQQAQDQAYRDIGIRPEADVRFRAAFDGFNKLYQGAQCAVAREGTIGVVLEVSTGNTVAKVRTEEPLGLVNGGSLDTRKVPVWMHQSFFTLCKGLQCQ
jgi:hypothetical protein